MEDENVQRSLIWFCLATAFPSISSVWVLTPCNNKKLPFGNNKTFLLNSSSPAACPLIFMSCFQPVSTSVYTSHLLTLLLIERWLWHKGYWEQWRGLNFDAFITACGFCYESYTYITGTFSSRLFFFLFFIYCYQCYNSLFEAQYRADILQRIKWRCRHCFSTLFGEEEPRDFFFFPASSLL